MGMLKEVASLLLHGGIVWENSFQIFGIWYQGSQFRTVPAGTADIFRTGA